MLFVVENGVVLLLKFLLKFLETTSRPSKRHNGGIARLSPPTVVIEGVDLSSQVVISWCCNTLKPIGCIQNFIVNI